MKKIALLVVLTIVVSLFVLDSKIIHAQGKTKIVIRVEDDKKADDKKDGDKKDNVVPVTPPKEISINPKDPDNTGDDRTPTSKGKTAVSDTPTPSIPSGGNNSTDNSSGNVDGESVPSSTSQQSSKYDPQALEEDSKESTDDSQALDENSETSSADPQNSEEESMGNKEDEEKTKQSSEAKRGNTIRVLLYTFAVIILVLLVGCVSIYIINNKDKVKNSKIFKG